MTEAELTERLAGAVKTLELNALAARERGDVLTWTVYSAAALAAGEIACSFISDETDNLDGRG